ncbi:hypothetical protein F2P56_015682 [Juglans regia]|uniref:imidazoleglycerol-phosphate dehydratase n=1 Tax=Juglans regia TaxID=51240 RepID=A0A833XG06_JUGRE|nr:hypothetical protein F2P56_015682 [Juglans regia]
MELAAPPRLVYCPNSSPLPKHSVKVSQRPIASTPTSFAEHPSFSLNSGLLLRTSRYPHRLVACAASVADNGSTIAASPSGAGARIGEVKRVTKETNVAVKINLDGSGVAENNTGIPFLDHMLDAFLQALGDRRGINRFGDFSAPLDEALVHVALDLSGRPHLGYDLRIPTQRVGAYDTQLVEHFFQSLVNTSGMTLHIRQLAGRNSHHIIEATFKAFARALRQATEYDPRRHGTVPSSKGVLSRS